MELRTYVLILMEMLGGQYIFYLDKLGKKEQDIPKKR